MRQRTADPEIVEWLDVADKSRPVFELRDDIAVRRADIGRRVHPRRCRAIRDGAHMVHVGAMGSDDGPPSGS